MKNRLAILGLIASAGLFACAGQDDIDRTQPNRLPKAMFQGEWYMRSTVIDVPATVASTFAGYTGPMEKIVWEIQEDQLIAYRGYEEIMGSAYDKKLYDQKSGSEDQKPEKPFRENPIAAFRIQSHFDVTRNYNSSTGEQTNVISENTSDRPWYEREYMRVDWSESLINSSNYTRNDDSDDGATYWVQRHEADNPDAFRVMDSEGKPINFDSLDTIRADEKGQKNWDVNYFDMVGNILIEPEKVDYYGYKYPLCWFRGYETTTCDSAEVKVRTSFLKAGKRNFEPVVYDEQSQGKFGYFRTERFSLNQKYGITESGRIYLANVHNIWEKSFEENEDGTINYDRPIPLKDRTPKPVVYHLNPNYPCDMVKSALVTGESWNNAFRRTVAVAKGILTQTAGESKTEVAKVPKSVVPDMFTIGLNGWRQKTEGSDWSCENLEYHEEDVVFQIGDLRYNTLTWISDRQMSGPLGYGPSSADPNTGEIISGTAYMYGFGVDMQATNAVDIIRALNKDLVIDPDLSEDAVQKYVLGNLNASDPRNIPADLANVNFASREVFEKVLFKPEQLKKLDMIRQPTPDGKLNLQRVAPGLQKARRELLKGTQFELEVLDDEMIRALAPMVLGKNVNSVSDLSTDELRKLSPFNGQTASVFELDAIRREHAARNCIWLAEFADDSVIGLALEMWKRYGKEKAYTEMWQYLREKIFQGVAEHEIGHTVGLRHNFAGSYDSMNYHTRWWQLREKPDAQGNGGLLTNLSNLTFEQAIRMATQTDAQKQGRMREYQYSTIMDYGGKFNADIQGLGKYDEAALLFAYGKHVEVFNSVADNAKKLMRQRYGDCDPSFESRPNPVYPALTETYHYSTIWNLFSQTPGLTQRRFVKWDDLKKKQQGATAACQNFVKSGQGSASQFSQNMEPEREVEVPFMFCSDEYVGTRVSCYRWDEGADPMEISKYAIDHYRNYYFFNNFKRDRVGFSSMSGYNRANRYFGYLPNIWQHWLFNVQSVEGLLSNYWAMGMYQGFNLLLDVLAQPEYGTYQNNGTRWQLSSLDTSPKSDSKLLVIPPGPGRRLYSRWDLSGYNYYDKVLEAGHFWEQYAALDALTKSSGTFVGADTAADFTSYLIPYYIIFKPELTRYFEAMTTENTDVIAPRIMSNGQLTRSMNATVGLSNGTQIDPETGASVGDRSQGLPIQLRPTYTMRYLAAIYGMLDLNFDGTYTTEFQDRQLVFRLGSGTVNEAAQGFHWEICNNPISGSKFGIIVKDGTTSKEDATRISLFYMKQCQDAAQKYIANPNDANNEYVLMESVEWLNRMAGLSEVIGNGKSTM